LSYFPLGQSFFWRARRLLSVLERFSRSVELHTFKYWDSGVDVYRVSRLPPPFLSTQGFLTVLTPLILSRRAFGIRDVLVPVGRFRPANRSREASLLIPRSVRFLGVETRQGLGAPLSFIFHYTFSRALGSFGRLPGPYLIGILLFSSPWPTYQRFRPSSFRLKGATRVVEALFR